MSRFSAPIAEQIWDMKYRFKEADGTPLDRTVEDTWRRIARSLADVEEDKAHWEDVFYAALEDFQISASWAHHCRRGDRALSDPV